MRVMVEDLKISDIPALEVYDLDAAAPKPVVLILHSLGGCKEHNLRDAYYLVKTGFFVCLFDAYGHGEWQDGLAQRPARTERIQAMPRIIVNTVKMIDDLIENYRDNERVDYRRVGLLGRSMGGLITYAYITGERSPNVKAAVPIVATPAWTNLYHTGLETRVTYTDEELRWLEQHEPARNLQRLRDFPLLMLNGAQDHQMPIIDVRNSFLEIRKYYRDQDLVRLIEYEAVGHEVTLPMLDEAFAWFRKYL
jgi:dienelactone hydrolase